MLYNIIIRDSSGNNLPGTTMHFYDSAGGVVTWFDAGSQSQYSFDDQSDSELFDPGNTFTVTAPGYVSQTYPVSGIKGTAVVTMHKNYLPWLIGGAVVIMGALYLMRKKKVSIKTFFRHG